MSPFRCVRRLSDWWLPFSSKELPNTRIQPDRRWFGNARVVNQKELEFFREELQDRMKNPYNVILKERKLPLSLLNDHQKQARVHLLDIEPFGDAFGPKRKRKRPKLLAAGIWSYNCSILIKKFEIKMPFTFSFLALLSLSLSFKESIWLFGRIILKLFSLQYVTCFRCQRSPRH
ncbi:nuclear/nucleolar GTPase 2-like isoform X1 [Euphorbia lathyris]|uniref:nuclear/nucleolar GTPase 2-like isoform X1 n=1 Tax=Euphorbia lathyris TaxID=212925 RepID=UPI0033143209